MFSCICMTSMLLRWNIWCWTIVMRINGMYSYPHPIHLSIHHSLFSVWPCHLENQVSVVTEILIVLSPACKNSPLTWPSAHCPSLSKPGLVSWNAAFVLCFVKLHNGPDVVKLPYPLEHCYVNTTMDVIINHVTYRMFRHWWYFVRNMMRLHHAGKWRRITWALLKRNV